LLPSCIKKVVIKKNFTKVRYGLFNMLLLNVLKSASGPVNYWLLKIDFKSFKI